MSDDERFVLRREMEAMQEAHHTEMANHQKQHDGESQALRLALATSKREYELHAAAHDQAHESHAQMHEDAQMAVDKAFLASENRRAIHNEAHDREHHAHASVHVTSETAVSTALDAVARERAIHAQAHDREHLGHHREHELDKLAITKAEIATDVRFHGVNGLQGQLREQARSFASQERVDALARDNDRRITEANAQAHTLYEQNRLRIEALEKGDSKAEGRSLGQGAVVALIVGGAGLIATILGIILVVANFAARPG